MDKKDSEHLREWNKLHCEYIQKGASYRNVKMADHCEKLIQKARDFYYNSGETIMSDAYYDRLERWLVILKPDNTILDMVGAKLIDEYDI